MAPTRTTGDPAFPGERNTAGQHATLLSSTHPV